MKKVLSFVLALVMVMALSVTAFAANGIPNTGDGEFPGSTDNIDITANFTDNKDVVNHKYHVTVKWEPNVTISYSNGYTTYTWNTTETKYETKATDAAWSVNEGANIKITVENRSDGAIKAECGKPMAVDGVNVNIQGSYDNESNGTLTIGSAAGENYTAGEMQHASATYTIENVSGSISQSGTIATITVTVSADKTGGQTT